MYIIRAIYYFIYLENLRFLKNPESEDAETEKANCIFFHLVLIKGIFCPETSKIILIVLLKEHVLYKRLLPRFHTNSNKLFDPQLKKI